MLHGMDTKGRPSTYTPEIAALICERLATGESLRAICRDEGLPHRATVHRWLIDNVQGFCDQYARAREVGLDELAEEALEIADTPQEGEETEDDGEKVKVKRGDMLGHRKLQVDTRKWLLSKLAPKKYGEKTSMELTGANGGPVQISDTERAAKIAAILAAAKARKDGDVSDLV